MNRWMRCLSLAVLAAGALTLAAVGSTTIASAQMGGPPGTGPAEASEEGSGQAWLGVQLQAITPELAEGMKLPQLEGALVGQVIAGSPAEKAGIRQGDVILSLGGQKVAGPGDLVHLVAGAQPGRRVPVEISRNGQQIVIEVELASQPKHAKACVKMQIPAGLPMSSGCRQVCRQANVCVMEEPGSYLGIRVTDLGKDLGDYFGISNGKGVLILEVMADSPAKRSDLRSGDVILSVGKTEVSTTREFLSAVQGLPPDEKARLEVRRHGKKMSVEVTPEAKPESAGGKCCSMLQGPPACRMPREGAVCGSWNPCHVRCKMPAGCGMHAGSNAGAGCAIRAGSGMRSDPDAGSSLDAERLQQELDELQKEVQDLKSRIR